MVVVDVFRALDDETRRLVLDELSVRDGQTLFEICSTLTMRHGLSLTRQAISQHLGAPSSTLWLHDADNACGRLHLVYDRGRVAAGAVSGHPSADEPLPIDRDKPLFRRLFDGVVSIIDPYAEDGMDPRI